MSLLDSPTTKLRQLLRTAASLRRQARHLRQRLDHDIPAAVDDAYRCIVDATAHVARHRIELTYRCLLDPAAANGDLRHDDSRRHPPARTPAAHHPRTRPRAAPDTAHRGQPRTPDGNPAPPAQPRPSVDEQTERAVADACRAVATTALSSAAANLPPTP